MAISIPARFKLFLAHMGEEIAIRAAVLAPTLLDVLRNTTYAYATINRRCLAGEGWPTGLETSKAAYETIHYAPATFGEGRKVATVYIDGAAIDWRVRAYTHAAPPVLINTATGSILARGQGTGTITIPTTGQSVLMKLEIQQRAAGGGPPNTIYSWRVLEHLVAVADLPSA